ncbi:MAG TPA: RagB/SusD family nutrient uptake outer membrane protein [Gemmatimonadaceae bacterium]|nr:RagB/SusD family nutrient uptake outer membrane protein [Gemmatimonadaceae bacterium]
MTPNRLISALALGALIGCGNPLDVTPKGSIPEATAITDAKSAEAALTGAYAGLQDLSYYGEDFPVMGDLSSDNTEHTGSYTSLAEADANQLRADNETVADIWIAIYDDINRVNEIIAKVPGIESIDATEKSEILGEAYFLRALDYHNLVKLWGGVPLRLVPATSVSDAGSITRATSDEVYAQILKDLDSAAAGITATEPTTRATVGAVHALRARVLFYKGDYAGAEAEARAVEDMSYELAPNYGDLFSTTGQSTPEDIFRVLFTAQQYNNLSYYYIYDNRWEVAPTKELMHQYDPAFDASASPTTWAPPADGDARALWNIDHSGRHQFGNKYRSVQGTEYLHVIRFGEVVLIRAEALARLNQLPEAVAEVNRIRERANLPDLVLGVDVTTQDDVINEIIHQRRLELAFEGDRWPDLVRAGIATTVLGISQNQTLYPIPQREIDVTAGLTQNPGY